MPGFTPHRVLVPINGSPTDDEAVRMACRIARRQKARLYVMTVLEIKRSLALGTVQDAEMNAAEGLLENADGIAAEMDVEVETEILQAREAGPAIVDEVGQWGADLIIVGMPFRERFGEFYMGKTVPFILRHAACRALLFREPPPQPE
ncbi:MAG: universal stress protein [Candidatus Dormibacteria bacterium]